MDRSYIARLTTANSERVLLALTHQQHLHPGRSVAEMVQTVCKGEGFGGDIGPRALAELAIIPQTRSGRLSRQHLSALAEKLEATWQAELGGRVHPLEAKQQ